MRGLKQAGWLMIGCVMLALSPALMAAEPAVLAALPAGAPITIVVPSMSGLSKKIAMVNQKLQLNIAEMEDVLSFAKAMGGVNAGLDDGGALGVAMLSLPDPKAGGEPDVLLLIPVSDYKAFMGNFGVQDAAEGAATQIVFGGDQSFCRKSGKYAVVGRNKESVEQYKAGAAGDLAKRSGDVGRSSLDRSDLLMTFDLQKIGPTVKDAIVSEMSRQREQLKNLPNGEMAAGMLDLYSDGIQSLLRDGEIAVVGMNVSDAGFSLGYTAQFKPGSKLAAAFARGADKPLALNRLPSKPFIVAATMNLKGLPLEDWLKQISAKFPKGDSMGALFTSAMSMMKLMQGETQQAYYTPNLGGGGPPSLFNGVTVLNVNDPAAYNVAFKEYMNSLNAFKLGDQPMYQVSHTEKAKKIGGVDVDKYEMKINMPPEQMAQMGPAAMFLTQGMTGYSVVKDKTVIQSMGPDESLITDALAAADGSGKMDSTAGLAEVRKALPPSRIMEMYLGVGTLAQMANGLLAFFAPGMVMEVPADLAPIGMSVSSSNGGASFDLHVPMTVVLAVKNTVDKMQGQMRGGAAPRAARPAPAEAQKPESANLIAFADATFDKQVLKSDKVVVVDFWAVWCGPCKTQGPIISDLADEMAGKVVVGKVDVDKNPKISDQFKIESIPTIMIFKNGKVVEQFVGLTDKAKIKAAIAKAGG